MELSNIRTGLSEILHVRDMKLNREQRDDQLGPAYGVFFNVISSSHSWHTEIPLSCIYSDKNMIYLESYKFRYLSIYECNICRLLFILLYHMQ